ncbi:MAG TPA: class I SAM-dependent methyltransferase, partial [Opitutaceae bacterium]|nr:class I SAM-dependent methyltransferase [Opitutaceae bacterium]
ALADAGPNDTVLDLGCGDGAIVVAAARRCGARGIGIDCDPSLLAAAEARAKAAGVSTSVTFICGDLFAADFEAASLVCLYLAPAFYPPLQDRIRARARPGTRIVSHDYFFPGWSPIKTELVRVSAAHVSQIFMWRVP